VPFLRPGWEEAELRAARHPAHEDALQAERALVEALRARLPAADNALIIPVGSGRSALELALRVLARREPGRRKVLLPSYGCRGTFDPVLQAGLTPMFVDIDDDLRPDPQDLLDRLDESVLACLLVHLCGKRTPFEPVAERAKRLGVRLIEDNCQNLGGIGLDTPADLAIYSFGVGKQAMATAGGALVVHALKDAFLEAQRELGQEPAASAPARFEFLCNVGHPRWPLLNGGQQPHQMDPAIQTQFGPVRISPLDARLATVQLGKLDAIVAGHVANAGRFRAALGRYPRLFQCQDPDDHVYSLFSVRLPSAALTDRFRAFMDRCGVEVEGMYIPLHQRDFGAPFATRALPGSEAAHRHVVNLPVRPNLTERERVRIEKALDAFGKKERHAV
jgi:dTDP-4-amino-4,6-dideoxygalactose transaminase